MNVLKSLGIINTQKDAEAHKPPAEILEDRLDGDKALNLDIRIDDMEGLEEKPKAPAR